MTRGFSHYEDFFQLIGLRHSFALQHSRATLSPYRLELASIYH
jgi:hypothetical protein